MIKPKLKICFGCKEPRVIWKNHDGNKFCKWCWTSHKDNVPVTIKKAFKPIRKKSTKQAKLDQAYSVLRTTFFRDPNNERCQAQLTNCSFHATDVHHKKGRGEFLLNVKSWLAVCRSCHDYIEKHPIEAKSFGFSESRL